MKCPNDHEPMVRGRQNWVCEYCGYRISILKDDTPQEPITPRRAADFSILPGTEYLPYPAALATERLRKAIAEDTSAWDRISWFKDTVEAIVKSLCIYGLGAYFASPPRTPARDEVLLDLLVRPSTGHWVELLGVLCKYLRDESPPCRNLYKLCFLRQSEKDEPTECYRTLLDFVSFRNNLHHAPRRLEAEYERELQQRLPKLASVLTATAFLQSYPLLRPIEANTAEVWSGTLTGQTYQGQFADEDIGHFGFIAQGGRFLSVEPFVMFLACGECETDRLFLYDSQKSYGAAQSKKRIYMQEYDGGHRPPRYEPVESLEVRFTEELMQRVYNAFRKKMVAIERYLKDFGTLVEQHANIVGRQFVRDRIQQFLDSHRSGVFLLTGEPGIGKTAIMANLVEAELGRVHFFYRHTSGLRSPDDFITCILDSLLNKYKMEPEEKTSDLKEQRTQLRNLLPKVSGILKPGEKEIIVVDALDEAATSFDGRTAAQLLPQNLPDNIFFILSSRPLNSDFAMLTQRGDVDRFELQAASVSNKADAYTFVKTILGDRCTEETQQHIADGAEWNFLFLKLLCEAITKDGYSPDEIETFLARSVALQDWYFDYWERLQRHFEKEPRYLDQINSVIGAIAAASAPVTREQICESLGLLPGRFDWSLRYIGQYLDVIPVTEAGVSHQGSHELVLYRLYHFSFREFVMAKVHPNLSSFHVRWSNLLENWREMEGHEREYALRHLLRHLIEAQYWNMLAATLADPDFLRERLKIDRAEALLEDIYRGYTGAAEKNPALAERIASALFRFLLERSVERNKEFTIDAVHAYLLYKDNKKLHRVIFELGAQREILAAILPDVTPDVTEVERLHPEFLLRLAGAWRREGNLESAQQILDEQLHPIRTRSRVKNSEERLKIRARLEYERGYIYFLRGELTEAKTLFDASARYAHRAGDTVGWYISRCVGYHVGFVAETVRAKTFRSVLTEALTFFTKQNSLPDKSPHNTRWIMNVRLHLFEVACSTGDFAEASAQFQDILDDSWIRDYRREAVLLLCQARLSMLQENWSEAIRSFKTALESFPAKFYLVQEGAARELLDYGKALAAAGLDKEALAEWQRGLECPDNLGNRIWKEKINRCLNSNTA